MTQQATTPFWPLFTRRSDGKQTVTQKNTTIKNGPSDEQLDKTPNAQGQCDYYRLIDYDEPKHLDWRKKLGGMLLREIGGSAYEGKWQQCFLWDFPEGYRLYEHIKSKAEGQAKAVKNHSGGGHDRQDAYLYGHPKGPKKRFRSPVEFFPHLLWLNSDEAGDPENCTCKLCSPFQLEPEKPAHTPTSTPAPASHPQQIGRNPVVQIPVRGPSEPSVAASPAAKAVPVPQPRPAAPVPTQLPQPRSIDQQVDAQYGKFLARVGEVTWFKREGGAWGLGVITRRWLTKEASNPRAYMVQPLSYPQYSPPSIIVTEDAHLKPWLAWSVPKCTFAFLVNNPHLTYTQIDWPGLLSGRFGDGNLEVDGSIHASKMIDSTYTLFEAVKMTTSTTGQEERHWNGIFLGAEKIWNGEPIRLHIGSGTDVMVITDIIERNPNAPQTGATPSPRPTVHFVGDIYSFADLPAPDPKSRPEPPSNPYLPLRMREDLRWRNDLLVPHTRTIGYWKLVASQSRLGIADVKGRWYETSLIFSDLYLDAMEKGQSPSGIWMNARGECNGASKTDGIRVANRTSAFGASVPESTVLVDGLDPPRQNPPAAAKPQDHEMQGLEMAGTSADTAFALDDFMNLDGMAEDGQAAFEEPFHFDHQSGNWPPT
jgi:hypothetical protein